MKSETKHDHNGKRKLPDGVVDAMLQPQCHLAGWHPARGEPRKFLSTTKRATARTLGLPRETLRKAMQRLAYQKARHRSGMCDYCSHFLRYEAPLTRRIVQHLLLKLEDHRER